MLSLPELREMKALTERVVKGSVTREDWSNLAALTLIWQGDETVANIAAQGFDAFVSVAAPVYIGHSFHRDDYQRMYDRICRAAAKYHRDRVH